MAFKNLPSCLGMLCLICLLLAQPALAQSSHASLPASPAQPYIGAKDTIPAQPMLPPETVTLFQFINPLPIEWLGFTASTNETNVQLAWSTTIDGPTAYFAIERSADAAVWDSIGVVMAKPGKEQQDYSFSDPVPVGGNNYYRIRREAPGDSLDYSPVELVAFQESRAYLVSPNPVQSNMHIDLLAPGNHSLNILLLSMDGKVLIHQQASVTTGQQELQMGVGTLPPGLYILDIVDEKGAHPQKVAIL